LRRSVGRSRSWIYSCVAPVALLAVAINQLRLVDASMLTRWKGGGFGMFATVDSPGARFLRIHLLTEAEPIPVAEPEPLRSDALEIQSIPTIDRAEALAAALARGTWVRLRMESAIAQYERLAGRTGGKREVTELDFVRMLEPSEALGPDDVVVPFRSVRLEVLRYGFDPATTSLVAQPVLEVVADRESRHDATAE
jgi:hypothetical protein